MPFLFLYISLQETTITIKKLKEVNCSSHNTMYWSHFPRLGQMVRWPLTCPTPIAPVSSGWAHDTGYTWTESHISATPYVRHRVARCRHRCDRWTLVPLKMGQLRYANTFHHHYWSYQKWNTCPFLDFTPSGSGNCWPKRFLASCEAETSLVICRRSACFSDQFSPFSTEVI